MECFSLSDTLLKDILHFAKPFGHREDARSLNLGFGFLYYALVRALRPKHTLVIGSGYGFSVVCFALGIKDNGVGFLSFVDPSYCLLKDGPLATIGGRGMWSEENSVRAHFQRFAVQDLVKHYKMRNDEFFPAYDNFNLPPLDLAFIDGSHAYEDVKYDFTNVLARSRAIIFTASPINSTKRSITCLHQPAATPWGPSLIRFCKPKLYPRNIIQSTNFIIIVSEILFGQ